MLLQLQCGVQSYDWGKLGLSSMVAQFLASAEPDATIKSDTPYAELWMGTHPKTPSGIIDPPGKEKNLSEFIKNHPEYLGERVIEEFGAGQLPYLFKVLSIRKPLSIQAHPDKALAKQLHARDPKNYPDDNHKPEMAIALTDFEGFCGFRPVNEIASFLEHVPEFVELVGEKVANEFRESAKSSGDHKPALKDLFAAVMTSPDAKVSKLADNLIASAKKSPDTFAGPFGGKSLASLLVRCNDDFPEDIGLFCGGLMLNYCQLKKGEAMFLRAKDPHAYISGDIIECMAASDNVVRAGFTPKFKDVETLVDMLTYSTAPVAEQKMKAKAFPQSKGEGKALLFDPPIDEFSVLEQETPKDTTTDLSALHSASIFVVTEGKGEIITENKHLPYKTGSVFFVGANTSLQIKATEPTMSYHALA